MTSDRYRRHYSEAFERASFPYPYGGYDELLDAVFDRASLQNPSLVLDLGAGEGNLAAAFLAANHEVHAIEGSEDRIGVLTRRFPEITAHHLDLQGDVLPDLPEATGRFGAVVTSYYLHRFSWEKKLAIIEQVFAKWLTRRGPMVIGDLSFETRADLEAGKKAWASDWVEEYCCWVADETREVLVSLGYKVSYSQVGPCAGVYRLTHKKR